jgi:hypothetical protein
LCLFDNMFNPFHLIPSYSMLLLNYEHFLFLHPP